MKISSISDNNFGAFLVMPISNVNAAAVPAIVRSIDRTQLKSANWYFPKFQLNSIPLRQGNKSDSFILHEAVVPDTKIRVVGLPHKSSRQDYSTTRLKRNPGRKHIASIWLRK